MKPDKMIGARISRMAQQFATRNCRDRTSASRRALRRYQRGWPDVGFFAGARGWCRPSRAKTRVGRFTQGAARGLALPWANEWLRRWREEGSGANARIDGENPLEFGSKMPEINDGGLPRRSFSRNRVVVMAGWLVRQREIRGQRSEERCDFVSQDVGGEWIMGRDCPEIRAICEGGGGGVKAPEGWRSPRPGGLRGGLEHGEHPWGLRQRVCEADWAAVGMRRMLGSGWGFVLEDIGGEWVIPQDYPELSRRVGPTCGTAPRNPAASGTPPYHQSEFGVSRSVCEGERIVPPLPGGDLFILRTRVSLRATPGYSNGIPSGCGKAPPRTLFKTPEYPESTL